MAHDSIDICTWISTSQNQANFTDHSVNNVTTLLLELVGINRELIHISVLNQFSSHLSRLAVIECAIGVNAFRSILEQSMAKDIIDFGVLVIPDKRNLSAIIIDKCIFHDCSAVGTSLISNCGPTTEIIVINYHFDFSSLLLDLYY